MNKKIIIISFIFFVGAVFLRPSVFAETNEAARESVFFEAKVLEVLEERQAEREGGSKIIQQDLKLKGLTGEWKNKEFVYKGISDLDIITAGVYKKGDRVVVNDIKNENGSDEFLVVDYVRRAYIYFLAALFSFIIILIGKWKGLKALLGLVVTFIVIMQYFIPQILAGSNPLITSLIGSLIILVALIYFTEGWNRKSHLAVLSIFFSLFIILVLSVFFTKLARLSGMGQEEAAFLIDLNQGALDFRGLLLAGILLGAIGVLDDGVVSQIETVSQIRQANPKMSKYQLFKAGFAVGKSHLGAIINTLFLTYVGASLPLLLLFKLNQGLMVNYSQVINSEVIATEIVRTLVGSIGVALSLPIAAFLAAYVHKYPHLSREH